MSESNKTSQQRSTLWMADNMANVSTNRTVTKQPSNLSVTSSNSEYTGPAWFNLPSPSKAIPRSISKRTASSASSYISAGFSYGDTQRVNIHQSDNLLLEISVHEFPSTDLVLTQRTGVSSLSQTEEEYMTASSCKSTARSSGSVTFSTLRKTTSRSITSIPASPVGSSALTRPKSFRKQLSQASLLVVTPRNSCSEELLPTWPRLKRQFDENGGSMMVTTIENLLEKYGLSSESRDEVLTAIHKMLLPGEDMVSGQAFFGLFLETLDQAHYDVASDEDDNDDEGEEGELSNIALFRERLYVTRMRHTIFAGVPSRGLAVGGDGDENIERVVEGLGCSVLYMKMLVRLWLESKPVLTQSRLHGTTAMPPLKSPRFLRPLKRTGEAYTLDDLTKQLTLQDAITVARELAVRVIQKFLRKSLHHIQQKNGFHERVVVEHRLQRIRGIARAWFEYHMEKESNQLLVSNCFLRWRNRFKRMKYKRYVFQHTFWLLFTWRRYANRQTVARRKAIFLRRVWLTLLKLRVFRAWSDICANVKKQRQTCLVLWHNSGLTLLRTIMHEWSKEAKSSSNNRKIWKLRGHMLQNSVFLNMTREVFNVWRYYSVMKRETRLRAKEYCNHTKCPKFFDQFPKHRRRVNLPIHIHYPEDQIQPAPTLEEVLGPDCKKLVKYPELMAYSLKVQEKERLMRGAFCIERNRSCPAVFYVWREFVEEKQKKRYAWYHYRVFVMRRVLLGWRRYHAIIDDEVNPEELLDVKEAEELLKGSEIQEFKSINDELIAGKISHQKEIRQQIRWQTDEQWKQQLMDNALKTLTSLREANLKHRVQMDRHRERIEQAQKTIAQNLEIAEGFIKERKDASHDVEIQYAGLGKELMQNRGKLLHDALDHVFDELAEQRIQNLRMTCFRMLRFPVIYNKSFSMFQRQRIKNWIRICVRMRKLWNAMPRFHNLKTKWTTFNKWLRYMDEKTIFESAGLRDETKRRKEHLRGYSKHLFNVGVAEGMVSMRGCFLRWAQYVQQRITRKRILALSKEKLRHNILSRFFHSWHTGLRPQYTYDTRSQELVHRQRCVRFDLDRWKTDLVMAEYKSYAKMLKRNNKFEKKRLRESVLADVALSGANLKVAMLLHKRKVRLREDLETKLLCQAFDERGTFVYEDVDTPMVGLQTTREQSPGTYFSDPVARCRTTVQGVRVFVSDRMVIALQLIMHSNTGPSSTTWEYPLRGSQNLTGATIHVFKLAAPEEKLVAIEGYAQSSVVGGKLRFITSKNRVSRWYGDGISGKQFRVPSGPQLDKKNGAPLYVDEYIVGLHGHQGDISLMAMGAVIRGVVSKNIFHNCWTDRYDKTGEYSRDKVGAEGLLRERDMEIQESLHQRAFQHVMSMRSIDIHTAMERCQAFATRVQNNMELPEVMRGGRIVSKLSIWYFDALSHELINMPTENLLASSKPMKVSVSKGYQLISKGTAMMKMAHENKIKYHCLIHRGVNFDIPLTAGEIGSQRLIEIEEQIQRCNDEIEEGKATIARGREIVDDCKGKAPKLLITDTMSKYFENLVHVAMIKCTLNEH